jgi:uncharacterized protein (TIGR03790 family)
LVLFVIGLSRPCSADLRPDEIAIIAARNDVASDGLAKYYAQARGVPAKNICRIDVPKGENLPRDRWQSMVRPAIRKWLAENDPNQKIRCLVTVWGIPLRIGPAAADANLQQYQQFLVAEREHRIKLLDQVLIAFNEIAPDASNPGVLSDEAISGEDVAASPVQDRQSKPDEALGTRNTPSPEIKRIQQRLEAALQRTQTHLASLPEGESRTRSQVQVQQLATATGGLHVLLPALNQGLAKESTATPTMRAEFDAMRGRVTGLNEARALLEQMPANIERDTFILAVLERLGGLIATVQWVDQQLYVAKLNETGASFDSELSLVAWPDGYELLRWQPNYLRPGFANSQLPKFNRTLMVSRIDAPTPELAKGLIDTAISVEKEGLRGKVYFDARGIAKNPNDATHAQGSFGDFDRCLLNIARAIDEQTDLETVVETTPQLFQPGQCPDAALYCGWYSLAKYVDAFDWKPGAVAYHLASSEMATLHDARSQVWCKRLLDDGVCVTIGPVYEPYLAAFPRPDEFFALLLRGDLTLAECYYQTQPFNSWMMALVGDPLYRPFRYRAAAAPAQAPKPPADQAPTPAASGK